MCVRAAQKVAVALVRQVDVVGVLAAAAEEAEVFLRSRTCDEPGFGSFIASPYFIAAAPARQP